MYLFYYLNIHTYIIIKLIKDQKFDKMLAATRQIIKKRSELEKTVKEQLEK